MMKVLAKIRFKVLILLSVICSFYSCDMNQDKEFIFIGDSIVEQWDTYRYFSNFITINNGISGTKVEDWNKVIKNYEGKVLVILIGTNNLPAQEISEIEETKFLTTMKEQYNLLLEKNISEKLYLISVLPRGDGNYTEFQNTLILKLNTMIKNIVSEHSNVKYIDALKYFVKNGEMNKDFSLDGVHLNNAGYEVLSSLIIREL